MKLRAISKFSWLKLREIDEKFEAPDNIGKRLIAEGLAVQDDNEVAKEQPTVAERDDRAVVPPAKPKKHKKKK